MLTLAEQLDTFYLRIQKPEEQDRLRKKEILVRWSVSSDQGITWEYLRHEFFERPTLVSDWTMTDSYQVGMNHGLRALIESQLEWEFWSEFTPHDPEEQGRQRLPIDRRRLIQVLMSWRISKMFHPKTVQEAVDALRQRVGGSVSELARQSRTNHTSLHYNTAGLRGLSGSVMTRLASLADQLMEWKCAEVLRSHAMVASLNVSRKGGHR